MWSLHQHSYHRPSHLHTFLHTIRLRLSNSSIKMIYFLRPKVLGSTIATWGTTFDPSCFVTPFAHSYDRFSFYAYFPKIPKFSFLSAQIVNKFVTQIVRKICVKVFASCHWSFVLAYAVAVAFAPLVIPGSPSSQIKYNPYFELHTFKTAKKKSSMCSMLLVLCW